MNTQVGKWGNSLAVRIPGTYSKELDLEVGTEVEVIRVDGGLLLRPRKRAYKLVNEISVRFTRLLELLDAKPAPEALKKGLEEHDEALGDFKKFAGIK